MNYKIKYKYLSNATKSFKNKNSKAKNNCKIILNYWERKQSQNMFITILEIFTLWLEMDFKLKILSLKFLKKFIKYPILMKILSVKLEIIGRKQVLSKLLIITKSKSILMTMSLSNILIIFYNISLKSNKKRL